MRNGCGSKPPGPSRILGFRNQPGTPARFILRRGISDTYALGVLAEITGLDVPIVVLPFVNTALASRPPFHRSVEALRAEGVRILLGPGGVQPHPPRTGGKRIDSYPWHLALDEVEHLVLTHR